MNRSAWLFGLVSALCLSAHARSISTGNYSLAPKGVSQRSELVKK